MKKIKLEKIKDIKIRRIIEKFLEKSPSEKFENLRIYKDQRGYCEHKVGHPYLCKEWEL